MSDIHHHSSETSDEVSIRDVDGIHGTAKTLIVSSVVYNMYLLLVPVCLCFLLALPFIFIWYSGIVGDTVYFYEKEGIVLPVLIWTLIVLAVVVYFALFLNKRNNLYIILGMLNIGKAACTIPVHLYRYVRSLCNDDLCREFVVGVMPPGVTEISVIGIVRAFIKCNYFQKTESQVFTPYSKAKQSEENELVESVAVLCGYASSLNGGSPLCKKAFVHGIKLLDSSKQKRFTACFNDGINELKEPEKILSRIAEIAPDELFRRKDFLNTMITVVYAQGGINRETLSFIVNFGEVLGLSDEDINYCLKNCAGGKYRITVRKKSKKASDSGRGADENRHSGNLFSDMKSETVKKYRNDEADMLLMSLLGYIVGSFGEMDAGEKHDLFIRMLDSVGMPAEAQYERKFEAGASVKYAPYDDIEKFKEKYQKQDPDEIKLLMLKLIRMMHVDGDISGREQLIFSQIGLGLGFHEEQTAAMIAREKKRIDAIESAESAENSDAS